MGRPKASCITSTTQSHGVANAHPQAMASNADTGSAALSLKTGKVVEVSVNGDPTQSTADYITVTVQPTGTQGAASQVHADCLFLVASKLAGGSGIPRIGTHVYYLQVGQTTVCLGAMYTSNAASPWPSAPSQNELRSTGLRIPDIAPNGSNTAVPVTGEETLFGSDGLMVPATNYWPADETVIDPSDASPGHHKSLTPLIDAIHPLLFNEIAIQSRTTDASSTATSKGGVSMYGQDFISQVSSGSIAASTLNDYSISAGKNIHIEASDTISFKVGSCGITITRGGIVLSQNNLAPGGCATTLTLSQTTIGMFAMGVKVNAFASIDLNSFGSKLSLKPFSASLQAIGQAKCVAGWYNYSGGVDLALGIGTSSIAMCMDAIHKKSADRSAWGLMDKSLSSFGVQVNWQSGSSWLDDAALPSVSPSTGWMSVLIAIGSTLGPAALASSFSKQALKANASGFIAKGNQAFMLGGFYVPGFVSTKMMGSALSELSAESKTTFNIKKPILPVASEEGINEGMCLMAATSSAESKVETFSAQVDASLGNMTKMGAAVWAGAGPLAPFFGLASGVWSAGAAAASATKGWYASRAASKEGLQKATSEIELQMVPMKTSETAPKAELLESVDAAVSATAMEDVV